MTALAGGLGLEAPGCRARTDGRRTTGGSKYSIGIVSHWVIGSPPPCWMRQKRSISTSQPWPLAEADPLVLLHLAAGTCRNAEVTSRRPSGVATSKLRKFRSSSSSETSASSRPNSVDVVEQAAADVLARSGGHGWCRRRPARRAARRCTRRASSWPRRCACQAPSGRQARLGGVALRLAVPDEVDVRGDRGQLVPALRDDLLGAGDLRPGPAWSPRLSPSKASVSPSPPVVSRLAVAEAAQVERACRRRGRRSGPGRRPRRSAWRSLVPLEVCRRVRSLGARQARAGGSTLLARPVTCAPSGTAG